MQHDDNNGFPAGEDNAPEIIPAPADGPVEQSCPAAKPPAENRFAAELMDWVRSIVIAIALALALKATVVQAYMIPTPSMAPTVAPKDRVFGNRVVYYIHNPQRGDIIAFKPPPTVADDRIPYLKRVIAVGGDTVRIHNGKVYVNKKPLAEKYIQEPFNFEMQLRHIPKDSLFVMGDNRNSSYDSRYWGCVPVENVQAKAFFRFWPPDRIGVVR